MQNLKNITYNRRLKKINEMMISDYEDYVDETLGSGITPDKPNFNEKYGDTIKALILGMFTVAATANNDTNYQHEVYKIAEQKAEEVTLNLEHVIDSAYSKLEYVNVDKEVYNQLRNEGADILTTLHISDPEHAKPYTEISPKLIRDSLDARIAMTQSLADYTYFTNILDYDGNKLYTHKVWLWSQAEDTRHSQMDDQTVPIDEMFQIVNEVTGDEDEGMFPRDDDNISPSNSYNCLCDIKYITIK